LHKSARVVALMSQA